MVSVAASQTEGWSYSQNRFQVGQNPGFQYCWARSRPWSASDYGVSIDLRLWSKSSVTSFAAQLRGGCGYPGDGQHYEAIKVKKQRSNQFIILLQRSRDNERH
jgi:hypothetical protein